MARPRPEVFEIEPPPLWRYWGHRLAGPAQAYDPDVDPEGLIPMAAKVNRERYRHVWEASCP